LLGASHRAVWLSTGGDVIVVSTSDGVRLPNGVALGVDSAKRPFAGLGSGDPAGVGGGVITLPGLVVRAVRWWNPRPALPCSDAASIRSRIAAVRLRLGPIDDRGLGPALANGDTAGITEVAVSLLGLGHGLTPQGDDLVAGAFASHRLIGIAVGSRDAGGTVDGVAAGVLAVAADRTTALSAALLRHACRGEVADPVGRFIRALAGRGDLDAATEALLAVGHSSGAALAAGILAGAEAACEEERP